MPRTRLPTRAPSGRGADRPVGSYCAEIQIPNLTRAGRAAGDDSPSPTSSPGHPQGPPPTPATGTKGRCITRPACSLRPCVPGDDLQGAAQACSQALGLERVTCSPALELWKGLLTDRSGGGPRLGVPRRRGDVRPGGEDFDALQTRSPTQAPTGWSSRQPRVAATGWSSARARLGGAVTIMGGFLLHAARRAIVHGPRRARDYVTTPTAARYAPADGAGRRLRARTSARPPPRTLACWRRPAPSSCSTDRRADGTRAGGRARRPAGRTESSAASASTQRP